MYLLGKKGGESGRGRSWQGEGEGEVMNGSGGRKR